MASIPILFVAGVYLRSRAASKPIENCAHDAYRACIFALLLVGGVHAFEHLGWTSWMN